jgi:hypothetical protein
MRTPAPEAAEILRTPVTDISVITINRSTTIALTGDIVVVGPRARSVADFGSGVIREPVTAAADGPAGRGHVHRPLSDRGGELARLQRDHQVAEAARRARLEPPLDILGWSLIQVVIDMRKGMLFDVRNPDVLMLINLATRWNQLSVEKG